MKRSLTIFLLLVSLVSAQAQSQVIDGRMHHLRKGIDREWDEFPLNAAADHVTVTFNATVNPKAGTIQIRQYDVKQSWQVLLNDKQIGELTEDEKDVNLYVEVPAGII